MALEQMFLENYELNLGDYKPLANKKDKIIKENAEADNNSIRLPNGVPLHLNNTAFSIFELCDGTNSIQMILNKMFEAYDVDMEVLKNDVITNLYSLWKVGLLVWVQGKNPFLCLYSKKLGEGVVVKSLLFPEARKDMGAYLGQGITDVTLDEEIRFTPQNIRSGMEGMTDFYFSLEVDHEVAALVCMSTNMSVLPTICNLSYKIDFLYLEEKHKAVLEEHLDEMLEWAGCWVEQEMHLSTINDKVVFFMKIADAADKSQENTLKKLGFVQVGRLKKELEDADVLCMQKIINIVQ